MVEFRFFADRNFLGAVVVALIVSFAMLGVFFFLALYMQDILRYSPLEAGIRFLPSTLMIVGVAPIAGRLADRFGPRWLIAAGLLIVAASLYSFSGIAVDSSYLDLLPGFMLLGIGIALTMSPMTSAAMNAVAGREGGDRLRACSRCSAWSAAASASPSPARSSRAAVGAAASPTAEPAGLRRRASATRWASAAVVAALGAVAAIAPAARSGAQADEPASPGEAEVGAARASLPPVSRRGARRRPRARRGSAARCEIERWPRGGLGEVEPGSVSTATSPSAAIVSRLELLDRGSARSARA